MIEIKDVTLLIYFLRWCIAFCIMNFILSLKNLYRFTILLARIVVIMSEILDLSIKQVFSDFNMGILLKVKVSLKLQILAYYKKICWLLKIKKNGNNCHQREVFLLLI